MLILIVGFSAWNTGNNLLFLVLSFLIAAMVVGFFAGSICLKKLDVTMRFPETIFAGEPTPILVSMNNRKRLFPAFSVVVEVRGKERERSIAAAELDAILPKWMAKRLGQRAGCPANAQSFCSRRRADKRSRAKTEHIFPNRGRLLIKDFELSTKFPFGFFRHRRRLPAREAELIVFPKLNDVTTEIDNMPLDLGKRTSGKRGSGQDLLALRDYQPQDDLRRVDWKATARTRQLTVREFAAEDEIRVTVIFDTRYPPKAGKTFRSAKRSPPSKAANRSSPPNNLKPVRASRHRSLLSLSANKAEIRLVIDGDIGEFGIGRSHLHDSLKRLALVEPNFSADATSSEPEFQD